MIPIEPGRSGSGAIVLAMIVLGASSAHSAVVGASSRLAPAVRRSWDAAVARPAAGGAAGAPGAAGGFAALRDDGTAIPPDTMGAVGPDHVMTMLNTQVRVQGKDGTVLGTASLGAFWTVGTGLSGSPFDPRLLYDAGAGRWIASVDADASGVSQIWLAVSDGGDPTGTWTFFPPIAADAAGMEWADFPLLGFNQTWIVLTANMFSLADDSFDGVKMWVVDKASALASGPLALAIFPTSFDEDPATSVFSFSMQPASSAGADPALYLVDSSFFVAGATSLVRLSRLTGSGPAPVWQALPGSPITGAETTGLFPVPAAFNYLQIGAPQPGVPSTCLGGPRDGLACLSSDDCQIDAGGACRRIDTGDARVSASPVVRAGRLWFAHSGGIPASGTPDRTAVFWYEIDPAAAESTGDGIVQSGMIAGPADTHLFFPSIAVNAAGDAWIGFSRADATRRAEAAGSGRSFGDPLGTLGPVTTLKAGEDAYLKTFDGPFNRWGDYSATVVDPADDATFWTLQEYAATDVGTGVDDDRWGTWWTRIDTSGVTTTTTVTSTTTTTLPAVCAAMPAPSCETGKGTLRIKEKKAGSESLRLALSRLTTNGGVEAIGDPVTGESVYLGCLYDGADALIGVLEVDRARETCGTKPCWKRINDGAGLRYKDPSGSDAGVRMLTIVGSAAGKGRARIVAKNKAAKGQTALPTGLAAALAGGGGATAQVVVSDGGCFGATLSRVKRATPTRFDARTP